ncbi:TPA: DeoR family transcriptional regulator, partial [Staphylococcus pseudintermedius]|nr:DeoR family transcriptional regulator [Staphylococcus pseudintermedius]
KEDFVSFCELKDLTAIVTNTLNNDQLQYLQKFIEII